MSRRAALSLKIVALALLVSAGVQAHDFWIDPSSFRPAPGQRVLVRLRVGQKFKGDPMPRDPKLLRRFSLFSGNGTSGGETPVPGVAGAEPAGFATVTSPGLNLITYVSGRSSVELDAARFETYLADEGLETIKAQRARKGQTAAPAREVFSRYAKSYLAVGGAGGPGYDRVLALTLELVPEKDPTALTPLPQGTELPVRLLYLGKPLPGVLVAAFTRDQPDARVMARTDAAGRARLRLDHPGVWLVKAVHMIQAPADAGADWESFWASLTFETVKSS
ncbi:MAG TPA: DUF4198 domain-containing protein [Thermoanaerobaculia bacterium]